MRLAIEQAGLGVGFTSPNPPVGAVIVKNGKLLGSGYHAKAGEPHAEREAIADTIKNHSADSLRGATIYITLEPCTSRGRTPPCSDGILEAGITRVVYGANDPNPKHAGVAEKLLSQRGLLVTQGVCEQDCQTLIRPFTKVQQAGLPWVILKSAVSLDGRITRVMSEGQWLTSPDSRQYVQQMRLESDAILTGGNTLRKDDPALTVRMESHRPKPQPWRMIVSRGHQPNLPNDAKVFTDAFSDRTVVQLDGDIRAALLKLVEKGCNTVLVEAGGNLMGAFLDAGLADELAIFYAPMITGGPDAGFLQHLENIPLREPSYHRIGNDILLRALVHSQ